MHQPSGQHREGAGNDDAAEIHAGHMAVMRSDVVPPGSRNRLPASKQHIDRQQVNWTETANQFDFMGGGRARRAACACVTTAV